MTATQKSKMLKEKMITTNSNLGLLLVRCSTNVGILTVLYEYFATDKGQAEEVYAGG